MRFSIALALAVALTWSTVARAGAPGDYRAAEGPELAAQLVLRADGSYAYAMAIGALDETSRGRWREENGTIRFETEPRPVPAEFRRRAAGASGPKAPFLLVTWPNGAGIAGIDFRIAVEQGEPITGYTQEGGWEWPADEKRIPLWIELAEPIHRVASPRHAISSGESAIRFELVPNDLGVVDFTQATATRKGNRLTLHRPEGDMKFLKAGR